MYLQIMDGLEGGLVHTTETFGSCIWLCWTLISFRVFKEIFFFYGFGVYRLHLLYFCRRHMPVICGALMKKEGSLWYIEVEGDWLETDKVPNGTEILCVTFV